MVGDNPEEGVVRGNLFVHPPLRFSLEFPEGWEVMNTPTQVAAREPGQPHFMLLQTVDRPSGRTIDEIGVRSMANAGFKAVDGQRLVAPVVGARRVLVRQPRVDDRLPATQRLVARPVAVLGVFAEEFPDLLRVVRLPRLDVGIQPALEARSVHGA